MMNSNFISKKQKGITLIALVITIIVLLILAGISLNMLSGESSIITKAGNAKELTGRSQIIEQAKLDLLEDSEEKEGENPTEEKIKEILGKYFTPDTIPEDLTDLNHNMTAKNGGYIIKLSEILDGVTIKQEVKETYISKTDNYVGYYADIDNDGDVDGIIYADMIFGNTKGTYWKGKENMVEASINRSGYGITKIEDVTIVKDYIISPQIYDGQTEAGIYEVNGFGEKEVLVPATKSTGTKDRFYVMTLEDFTNDSKSDFYWYVRASGKLDRPVVASANDFGEGKKNTIDMLNDYNNKTDQYGLHALEEDGGIIYGYDDLWNVIQDRQYNLVASENDSGKWFIPSKSELAAFGGELGITVSNASGKGLKDYYWSSTQMNEIYVFNAGFLPGYGQISPWHVGQKSRVRLSATF